MVQNTYNMPTLVHRGTGLAINGNGKPPCTSTANNGAQSTTADSRLLVDPDVPAAAAPRTSTSTHAPQSPSSREFGVPTTALPHPLQSVTEPTQQSLKSGDPTDIRADDGRGSFPFHRANSPLSALAYAMLPIKRTKKIAKPRKSTKIPAGSSSSLPHHARNIGVKNKGEATACQESSSARIETHVSTSSLVVGAVGTLKSIKQSSFSRDGSDKSAQSLVKSKQKKKGKEKKKEVRTQKVKGKKLTKGKKRLQSISPDGDGEQIKKKRAKILKSDNNTDKDKPSKTTTKKDPKEGMKSTARLYDKTKKKAYPSTYKKLDAEELKRIVTVVIDRVAEEILHCASFFESGNRPIVVIGSNGGSDPKGEIHQGEQHSSGMRIRQDASLDTASNNAADILPRGNEATGEGEQLSLGSLTADNLVILAVRRFVLEVYFPFLLAAKKNTGRKGNPNVDRIHLSTLLVIREMLIMNADTLFTFSNLKRSSISKSERMHLSRIFADAIVRNAAKRLYVSDRPEGRPFVNLFLQAMSDYESGNEAFQFALPPADSRTVYAYQGGGEMGSKESIIAKVGFNYARERHPLLSTRGTTLDDGDDEGLVQKEPIPALPSAVHVLRLKLLSPTWKVR